MKWAPPHKRYTTAEREALYERERGDKEFPDCNLCDQPILHFQEWEPSHVDGKPHALGGDEIGVAHKDCNRQHGYKVVIPQVAEVKRKYKWARGIKVARRPFRTKDKPMMRTVDGRVVYRDTREPWGSRRDD